MTALLVSAPAGSLVPAPRAATPRIPAQRRPVDRAAAAPDADPRPGRHRALAASCAQPSRVGTTATSVRPGRAVTPAARIGRVVELASRAGSTVTLAAMLVVAAAAAGLTDGDAPTGDAAAVATTTLR